MYQLFQKIISLLILLLISPIFPVLYILVKLDSDGPFIFKQKRMGKDKKIFNLYKIRTMTKNADLLKKNYQKMNEANGPVFKIKNDPRFTRVGKILSHTAVDEIPQFINVLKGEMALVGPRPFPIDEALNIPKKYEARFSVLPGMTSPKIIASTHKINFDKWMKLDLAYIQKRSILYDLKIFILTFVVVAKSQFLR